MKKKKKKKKKKEKEKINKKKYFKLFDCFNILNHKTLLISIICSRKKKERERERERRREKEREGERRKKRRRTFLRELTSAPPFSNKSLTICSCP